MDTTISRYLRSPYGVPNGLHLDGDNLWVVDQITDRVARIAAHNPNDYGITQFLDEIPSESSNTSGLTYGEGSLWLAANGPASLWRAARPGDAEEGAGEVIRIDPATGATQSRHPVPGGGGVHGIEYDSHDPGHLWITTLKQQTLTKVRVDTWDAVQTLPLPYPRAHGVVRVEDGIWVVFTSNRLIVKLDLQSGDELRRIAVPPWEVEPHGLTRAPEGFLYCDATTGWISRIVTAV